MLNFSLNPSWCTSAITSEPIFSTPNYNNNINNNNNNNNNIPYVEPFVYHNNNTGLFPYQSHGFTSNCLIPNTYYNNNYYYHEQAQISDITTTKKKPCSDRHSKIAVRNRLRHRRTRLSIDVARQLFELQDMLKFERASKAVGWLLVRAKADILKLKQEESGGGGSCGSNNSDDNASSDYELAVSGVEEAADAGDDPITEDGKGKSKRKYRRASEPRKAVYMSKEAREVARKRARERTLNKQTQRSMAASNGWVVEQVVPQQVVGGGVTNLVLPDDLFPEVGMLFEMVA